MLVLHHSNSGNNRLVAGIIADRLGCETAAAEDNPNIDWHDFIVFVVANRGDEELPQAMEDFLFGYLPLGKKYAVCELGNYFGYERDNFGCKRIVTDLLSGLGWTLVSEVSVDSLPELDVPTLEAWLEDSWTGS